MTDQRPEQGQGAARLFDVLSLALCAATLAALARVAAVFVRGRLLHQFTWVSSDLPWMTLVGNTIIFLGIALVWLVAGRWWAPARRLTTITGVLGLLLALSITLLVTEIWQYASLALSLGVAYQLVRRARHAPQVLVRRARQATVLALVPMSLAVARAVRSRGDVPPPATTGTSDTVPNVLLIILDTVRASSTSLFGYALRTTPVLDSIARESVVFDRAVATASWTLPSHCSLFTGRDAQLTSCRWMAPLDTTGTTLAEILRSRGVRTGGFVANHFYTTRETGLARGFDRWMDFQRTWKEIFCSTVLAQTGIVRSALWGDSPRQRLSGLLRLRLRGDPKPEHDRKDAATVNRDFLAWVDEDRSRPFFGFLNYFDAHDPYRAPPPFDRAFPEAAHNRNAYDGGIAYMDHQIGALLEALKNRGVLDRTIVVIASDHGELFGEHDLYGHGNSLYWPLLHVPLMIRYPSHVPAGHRVPASVSLRDVPSTVLDLAGVADPRMPGRSLVPTWQDSSQAVVSAAVAFVEKGTNWWGKEPARFDSLSSITVGSLQLVASAAGREELFDLTADPLGERDQSQSDTLVAPRTRLREALRRASSPTPTTQATLR